MGAWEEGRWV